MNVEKYKEELDAELGRLLQLPIPKIEVIERLAKWKSNYQKI